MQLKEPVNPSRVKLRKAECSISIISNLRLLTAQTREARPDCCGEEVRETGTFLSVLGSCFEYCLKWPGLIQILATFFVCVYAKETFAKTRYEL